MPENVNETYQKVRKYVANFPDKIIEWHNFCDILPKIATPNSDLKDANDIRREIERVNREIESYILSLKVMIKQGNKMLEDLKKVQLFITDLFEKIETEQKESLSITQFQCIEYKTSIENTIGICNKQLENLKEISKTLAISQEQNKAVVLINLIKTVNIVDKELKDNKYYPKEG